MNIHMIYFLLLKYSCNLFTSSRAEVSKFMIFLLYRYGYILNIENYIKSDWMLFSISSYSSILTKGEKKKNIS